jgi:hypothetical protein
VFHTSDVKTEVDKDGWKTCELHKGEQFFKAWKERNLKKFGFLERPGKECWNAIQESSRKQKEKLKKDAKKQRRN